MSRLLLAIALSLAGAAQAEPPRRVEIDYQVLHNGGPLAEVRHVLEHDGERYQLTETWGGSGLLALLGTVHRTSRGRVTAEGLRPLEYEDRRPRRDTAHAWFSWKERTLRMQFRDGPHLQPLPPQAQDRLSFLFAPSFRAPEQGPLEYHVADGKGVSQYVFDIGRRERLSVPAGEFDALRLDKREDRDRSTQIWLDAGSLLPLRVLVVHGDGDRIDQVVTRIHRPE